TAEGTGNKPNQMRKHAVALDSSYEAAELEDQKAVIDEKQDSKAHLEMSTRQIFGHNLFRNTNLSFEPSANLATPISYRLGPGDEVIIDIWGASENTIRQTISPEGDIQVKDLGPVHLNGMTVKEANQYLQREFSKIYSGIGGNEPNSQIRLTLGDTRTIQVNIMGEVSVPGTYSLSAFSTVFHALYRAGGVNKIGSLRGIKLVRNGKTIENLDVYEFIMKGKMNDDIRLQEGDVIIVNPYESLVEIVGKVKRPMYYEMKPTETVANLLEYAGGFTGDSYKKAIRLIRKSGREHQVFNVDEMDYSVFRLDDGDLVTVDAVLDRFENKVEISGAVYRSGLYQLDGEVNTVKQLIKKAEGLRGDAFLNRVLLDREHEDLSHEIIAIDLNGLLNGTVADIPLQKDDHLYIPSVNDLKEEETVSIYGEVLNPGTFLYSDKMTIEDLVVQAGGLREAAATTRVSVTRRIKNPKSTAYSSKLAETFAFDIKDGLVIGDADFYLQPFDMVQIRRSPAYKVQRTVSVSGEVLFSGSYALLKKNERLSDLIKRAGGITPDAYIKGGRLIRRMNDEERRRERDALRMARNGEGKDSISVAKLAITETYTVGIDMEKALANPGSDYDVVLREGDVIYIPEFVNTVKISGSVMYPNTVAWEKGAKLKYYINMAGGYGNMAKKKKAYIIYLNGTVARAKRSSGKLIQPGCEIVVPSKAEKQHMKFAEILGISSTTATMAAMVATLVNAFK
ncbi:SLBB domain-containing protein, partial [Bacteroides cellulosilyticus]